MKKILVLTISFCSMMVFGQRAVRKPVSTVPELSIYNGKGDLMHLPNLSKGKVTFIDFWFIPCGPCFAEMNMLHQLYGQFKSEQRFRFLTITFSDPSLVSPLLESRNTIDNDTYNYFKKISRLDTFRLPVYYTVSKTASSFKDSKEYLGKAFGFTNYPTIMIFDKQGKLVYNKTGFTREGEKLQKQQIEAVIKANL